VGFLFSKKTQIHLGFFRKEKDKIITKNIGFYVCSVFLSLTHKVNPSFSAFLYKLH